MNNASAPAQNTSQSLHEGAAREILQLVLHYPITRPALMEVEDAVFVDPGERALLRTARGLYELEVDYTVQHVLDELERLQDAEADGDEYLALGHALDLLQGEYGVVPKHRRPGSRAGELLAQMKREAIPPPLHLTAQLLKCSDIIGAVISEAQAANQARQTGQLRGPITGFPALDQKFGGFLPTGPSVVLGNTGAGKTALVMQIAATCGFPALYVTTEMQPPELFRRQMARVSGTFLGRIKSGEMAPGDVEALALQTAATMPELAFIDSTKAFANPAFLLECAKQVQGDAKTLLLVVDSLHTWTRGASSGLNEYEALNQNLLILQRLCHQLDCPALLLCEQSRAAIASGGGVNSGAGSRSIEYGAEIVFDLQAGKETDAQGEREVTVTLAKNRHGAAGVNVKLSFNGALQRFKVKQEWGAPI